MWSYYGSKSKIVNIYPYPEYDVVIEPFAGSARYALKYFEKDVLLVDKDLNIVLLWKYLQNATQNDILNLPKLNIGDDIRKIDGLCMEERMLLGYVCQAGSSIPGNIMSKLGFENAKTALKNIASQLHKIKHWKIIHGDYDEIENQKATWFIDPPYQFGGHRYVFSNKDIDFQELSKWCLGRLGQVIVCENSKADWLPFVPVKKIQGTRQTFTMESMWTNGKLKTDLF